MMSSISNNSINVTSTRTESGVHNSNSDSVETETEGRDSGIKRKPDQISRDGDTLELSRAKVSDALFKGYSDARLKSMFQNKEISRQQYDKAIRQKNDEGKVQVIS